MNPTAQITPAPASANRLPCKDLPASPFPRLPALVPHLRHKRQTNPTWSPTSTWRPPSRFSSPSPCVPVSEFARGDLGERRRFCVCPKLRVLTPGLAARDNDSGAACPATVCLLISQAETDRSCRVCRREHKDERSNP